MSRIILASQSEGRKELFEQLFSDDFITYSADIDEESYHISNPKDLVATLAKEKSLVIQKKFPQDCIFAFDTMVCCEGDILGKPENLKKAEEMLNFLNNKVQTVWTGYSCYYKGVFEYGAVSADLTFSMSKQEILDYISKHPVTKFAGAYAIQKNDVNIKILSGSIDVIIGAPMEIVKQFFDTYVKIN